MLSNYLVAEHLFAIDASENCHALMTNFAPFEVQTADRKPIFALTVHESQTVLPAPSPEWETIYDDRSEVDMPRLNIYRHADGWLMQEAPDHRAPICLALTMTPDFSSAQLFVLQGANLRFAIDNATMLLFAFATASLNTLEMHASVTVRGDYGYLFLGKSGTGKT